MNDDEHISDRMESTGANLHANRAFARMLMWAVPLGLLTWLGLIAALRWFL